jgi:hypothetical protein
MKLPVLKSFIDKTTGKPYNCGGYYESNNNKRIKELQEKGFLGGVKIEDEKIETVSKKVEAETAVKTKTAKE